jgi:ABC-type transport system involved in multi-copper enzyme maturation permease subunit
MAAVFYLQLRQVLGDRRLVLLALFLCLPVLLAFIIRWGRGFTPDADSETIRLQVGVFLFLLYPQVMCELLSLLFASSVLSVEIDGQTLTSLFTRPVSKWRILFAKYSAICATLAPPVVVSLVISWLVLGGNFSTGAGGPRLIMAMTLGVCASLAAYSAVFTLIGVVIPGRAIAVGLLYSMLEFALSYVPALLNYLTVTYYLRSLVARVLGVAIPVEMERMIGAASFPLSCAALTTMVFAALTAASLVVRRTEFVVARAES